MAIVVTQLSEAFDKEDQLEAFQRLDLAADWLLAQHFHPLLFPLLAEAAVIACDSVAFSFANHLLLQQLPCFVVTGSFTGRKPVCYRQLMLGQQHSCLGHLRHFIVVLVHS